ncbi:GFA family protein [Chelativorans salis]|uniref:CENP-V/GFA domain-containing protein n=1 Tax=Chelativorans salis TaxID=2978478 RepID=A0ABT2LK34_9HYPH|nr:hypothetical protein [Chelativorans sp. EGI FJ00035]MCT7374950.1 hypothetical protein [Chelativorans sp. EGI FJ00035]
MAIETVGKPIVTAACYCASCQEAGRQFADLPGASPVLNDDGGTGYVLFRKDRVHPLKGAGLLREYRLNPRTKTRRFGATCCSTPMFVEFTAGHWLTFYKARFPPESRPPLEMRVMTKDRSAGVELDDSVPNYAKHSGRFMLKLLGAWVAMGFRTPKIDFAGK